MKRVRVARLLSPRVYYILPLLLLGLSTPAPVGGAAAADVGVTVEPTMARGPGDAPVTIVEFSDYQ